MSLQGSANPITIESVVIDSHLHYISMQVAVVEVRETEQLYEDTQSIYEKFSPLKVKPVRDMICDRSAAAQALFSLAVRSGWETHGIELDEPTYTCVNYGAGRDGGVATGTRLSGSDRSLSGSVRSLNSSGSGSIREATQQISAPKLPPRRSALVAKDDSYSSREREGPNGGGHR